MASIEIVGFGAMNIDRLYQVDEVVVDGENGFLVEFNNKEQLKKAIVDLHKNENLRKKFICNSEKKIQFFNKEKMITETIKVLKSL